MLNNQQKELLFDYCLGQASEQEQAEAKSLISSNKQARQIYESLKNILAPLDAAGKIEPCPDELAERTIERLNAAAAASASRIRLQQLLTEQQKVLSTRHYFWQNVARMAAAAAVLLIIFGLWRTPLNYMRQKSRQQQCQTQLANIFGGISQYASDYDGQMPAVATAAGQPWWKVGYQGSENQSNTRHIWLLVKGGYVGAENFACPGKKYKLQILVPSQIGQYNDFPDRKYVTYSFRIRCEKAPQGTVPGRQALMADLNPLFEQLPQDRSIQLKIELNDKLLSLNSINHGRRGQNVLLCNGSVNFIKNRTEADISGDDIFTLQNTRIYQGCEVPASQADAFLAP